MYVAFLGQLTFGSPLLMRFVENRNASSYLHAPIRPSAPLGTDLVNLHDYSFERGRPMIIYIHKLMYIGHSQLRISVSVSTLFYSLYNYFIKHFSRFNFGGTWAFVSPVCYS